MLYLKNEKDMREEEMEMLKQDMDRKEQEFQDRMVEREKEY